jgi:uncharacterized membrane protein
VAATTRSYEQRFAKAQATPGSLVASRGPAANADAKVSLWVAVVSMLVLLIASAKRANLLLLRGLARSREVAMRLSLGATQGRILRQWLVERLAARDPGSDLARSCSHGGLPPPCTRFLIPHATGRSVLEPRFLAFTALVAIGTGLLASLVPAIVNRSTQLRAAPRLGAGKRRPRRLAIQRMLIGGQVSLAMLLLIGAGLFVTSLRNVRAMDLGIDVAHVLYVNLDVAMRKMMTDPAAAAEAKRAIRGHVEERAPNARCCQRDTQRW